MDFNSARLRKIDEKRAKGQYATYVVTCLVLGAVYSPAVFWVTNSVLWWIVGLLNPADIWDYAIDHSIDAASFFVTIFSAAYWAKRLL